jgi:hypothetical protein
MSPLARMVLLVGAIVLGCAAPAFAAGSDVTGTLVENHEDRADGSIGATSFWIVDGADRYELADSQPESLVGQRVRLVDADPAPGLQGAVRASGEQRLAPAVPVGPRSLLVILLTTPDKPTPAATVDQVRAAVFTGPESANAFFMQQSVGATWFVGAVRADGDITDPLAIGVAMAGCDYGAIGDAADAAASAAGWAVSSYAHVLYLMPRSPDCDFAGRGQLPGRQVWDNGYLDTGVVAHELGHNLGAHHANSDRCTSPGGAAVTLSASCESEEYGDPFDVMGLSSHLMSSWHRAQIGQLPAGQTVSLRGSQSVTLVSSDDFDTAGPRLLLVPRKDPHVAVSSWLAVERRTARAPFDLWASGSPVSTGLTVRLVSTLTSTDQTQLLDATPDTDSFDDAPVLVGRTLTEPEHGITIRMDSAAGTTAGVTVTMPTLVDDVPPSAPTDVSASGNTNAVTVRWAAAADDEALSGYEVQRDGVTIGSTPGLSFDDTRVSGVTTATYTVTAIDTSANRTLSSPVSVSLADVTPPSAIPGGVTATVVGGEVRLSWSAAQDNRALKGYRISRGGTTVVVASGLTYTDRPAAGRYVYSLRAVDTAGNLGPSTSAPEVTVAASSAGTGSTPGSSTSGTSSSGSKSSSSKRRPSIRLVSRSRRGRVVTMRFTAAGARTISAFRGSRRVARASSSRLTVRLTLPRGVRRPKVKVVATSSAGSTTRNYALTR